MVGNFSLNIISMEETGKNIYNIPTFVDVTVGHMRNT
jgi:hypothetical protein